MFRDRVPQRASLDATANSLSNVQTTPASRIRNLSRLTRDEPTVERTSVPPHAYFNRASRITHTRIARNK